MDDSFPWHNSDTEKPDNFRLLLISYYQYADGIQVQTALVGWYNGLYFMPYQTYGQPIPQSNVFWAYIPKLPNIETKKE